MATTKIRVTLTVEVDSEDWALTYGEFTREDVKAYIREQVEGSAAAEEASLTVTKVS